MMTEITYRWSGTGMVLGAAMLGLAIVTISFTPVMNRPFSPGVSRLLLLSASLLLLALPAMYSRQALPAGGLGLVGHVLLQTGILLLVVLAAPTLIYPTVNLVPGENWVLFLLGIALTLGLLLTGIATVRADVFPRWTGLLLLAATAGFFFAFFIAEFLPPVTGQIGSAVFGLLLAVALAGVGVALWTVRPMPAIGRAHG